MDNLNGLDVLEDLEISIQTRIGKFDIHPVNMKNFKRFSVLAMPLYADLMSVFDKQGDFIKLIKQHESSMIELLSLCSKFTQEHYDDDAFYPDDFAVLITGLVEVNMDFFVRTLLPKVAVRGKSMIDRLNSVKSKIGQIQSNAS